VVHSNIYLFFQIFTVKILCVIQIDVDEADEPMESLGTVFVV